MSAESYRVTEESRIPLAKSRHGIPKGVLGLQIVVGDGGRTRAPVAANPPHHHPSRS